MSVDNGIVDFETDFLPYFKRVYWRLIAVLFPGYVYPETQPPAGATWTYEDINGVLEGAFDRATMWLSNNPNCSPVPFNPSQKDRLVLYALIVAHMLGLLIRGPLQMGQITSGSQGSVSEGLSGLQLQGQNAQWWGQTQYGAEFWTMTLPYRSFRYLEPLWVNWK